ncbi:PREDICTED: ran-specific GTPase-activating protein-like [Nicrophorus vespilloides]|uniref:Ran-specific GTPase-activating protein-like n=1 Tax=Nicrophorus vespilloides TaxID=110193 RepID=A0ABM1N3F0_NICVS|nr:PREDICTED: ran-specific GTPase-activating protein-like [Nicrophorus vespilloides]
MAEEVKDAGDRNRSVSDASDSEYDPQYAPIITLPEVVIPTNEEEEEVVLQVRSKLYRFDRSDDIPEWKERGTGELKMLKHKVNKTVRIVMRRDKTLKVCANHFITPLMELKPKPGLDKAFVYNVPADFTDEEIKSECLAIKFGTVDIATQFKTAFLESQQFVLKECKLYNGEADGVTSSEDEEESEDDEEPEAIESNEDANEVIETLKDLNVTKPDEK